MFGNAGPTSKHSFKEGLAFVGLTDASYTIQNLVISANCFTTGLRWMQTSIDVAAADASSIISSESCPFILSLYSLKSAGSRCGFESMLDKR